MIVAWLIDIHACAAENKRAQAMRLMYFGELIFDLRQTIQYIPVAISIKSKEEHTWQEWVKLAEDNNILVTEGARRLQREKIKQTKRDISKILDQQLSVVSLGLITDDEMMNLYEIRTSLTALDFAFSQDVEGEYLKLAAEDLYDYIRKTRIVSFLNDEKFSLSTHKEPAENQRTEKTEEKSAIKAICTE